MGRFRLTGFYSLIIIQVFISILLCVIEIILTKKYREEMAIGLPVFVLVLALSIGSYGLILSGILFVIFLITRNTKKGK
jgi:hypothetical protein